MEIQYTRKLMTSYMRLPEAEKLMAWEEKMITYSPVEGVLFAEGVWEDGQRELWYDITGKQSLETVLGSELLQYERLWSLLAGIYEVTERLEGVLLRADALLLMPECIFLDYRTEQIYFCYYPGNPIAAADAFTELMEWLLVKLAHEDERAVELAYGVYERTVGGRLNLRELKELLRIEYGGREQRKPEEEVLSQNLRELEEEPASVGEYEEQSDDLPATCHPLVRRLQRWRERLQEILSRTGSRQRKNADEGQTFFFEPEPEEERVTARPTVLLTELSVPPEGILRYEGNGSGRDMVISSSPYTIGSEETCEGYLPSATVSRRHARITQKEEIYFIEDLNSSNGTYVGGELLDYRTKVSLQKNEIIIFADERFRFI